jgi:hypothetical protein
MPLEVFYSYSHKDEALRKQLETHLALLERNGLILPWHDRCIGAGDEWADQIDEQLQRAQIVLLLVSPDFLASNYCFDIEMNAALARHATQQAIVIPIILRPCDWSGAPFASLQALPRDAKAVTLWPNQDAAFAEIAKAIREVVVRFQQPVTQPPQFAGLTDQATPRPRVLDAAMPTHIAKDRATELLVLIRLPESKGLTGILQTDDEAETRPEDVRSKPFEVTFPQGPTGTPVPLKVTVELTSPDFSPAAQRKHIFVPVNADSQVCAFLLTPMRMGALTVAIELVWEDAERGYRRLRTNCVSEAELPVMKPAMSVVQLPMRVASEEAMAFRMRPVAAPAPIFSEISQINPITAAAAALSFPPQAGTQRATVSAPGAAHMSSFFSSAGLKVAAMAVFIVTVGTVYFQNSTSPPAAAVPSVPQAVAPAPPPSGAMAPKDARADLESTAAEFKRVSESATAPRDPEVAAAIKSGQKNLALARAESAKGNKRKAEEHLKLVWIAMERLEKN